MGGLRPRRLCKRACVAVSDSATIGRLRAVTIGPSLAAFCTPKTEHRKPEPSVPIASRPAHHACRAWAVRLWASGSAWSKLACGTKACADHPAGECLTAGRRASAYGGHRTRTRLELWREPLCSCGFVPFVAIFSVLVPGTVRGQATAKPLLSDSPTVSTCGPAFRRRASG